MNVLGTLWPALIQFHHFFLAIGILVLYWFCMGQAESLSLIGVDGGGTHCRFALSHRGRRFEWRGGRANALTDFSAAIASLHEGLMQLSQAADMSLDDLADIPAYFGLAGVQDDELAARVASELPLRNAVVDDDRHAAMVGALGDCEGCIVGIGTGSFLGRRADGVDHLIGGWGLVLGDEASGAYLGRQLLRRVLQVSDGYVQASPLSRDILAQFGSPQAIVSFAATALPNDFAVFAPRLVDAAGAGDSIARALMADGATYIETGITRLGWQPGEHIFPIGGLAARYHDFLSYEVALCVEEPKGTALDGALMLAERQSQVETAP